MWCYIEMIQCHSHFYLGSIYQGQSTSSKIHVLNINLIESYTVDSQLNNITQLIYWTNTLKMPTYIVHNKGENDESFSILYSILYKVEGPCMYISDSNSQTREPLYGKQIRNVNKWLTLLFQVIQLILTSHMFLSYSVIYFWYIYKKSTS